MAVYEIQITAKAAKELDALPRKKDRQAVTGRILALAEDPRPSGCVKLADQHALYRVRQGRYRIVYQVEEGRLVVIVIRIADRKDVYRKKSRGKKSQGRARERARPFGKRST